MPLTQNFTRTSSTRKDFTYTEEELEYVRTVVHRASGIALGPGKEYLIVSRLLPLARRLDAPSLAALLLLLRGEGASGPLQEQLVAALTTQETSFFRDLHPFVALRTHVLPALITACRAEGRHQIEIWSAACSTGQEPYSIAILLREHFPDLLQWHIRIRATDINREALEHAASGRYTQQQVSRGLTPQLLARYFHRHPGGDWQLNAEIMRMVEFSVLNLNSPAWPAFASAEVDLLCLRNVMIYFDDQGRRQTLARARQAMRSDGYLLLGTAETTQHLSASFAAQAIAGTTFFRALSQ